MQIYSENIFHKAIKFVHNMMDLNHEKRNINSVSQNYDFIEVGQLFQTTLSIKDLKNLIKTKLLELGISEYYLFLFEDYDINSNYAKLMISGDD